MKEAGLDVGILGMQEGCSGDAARRAGNEYLFQMLAETNLATFEEIGVKKIVSSCPHCFHTLELSTRTSEVKISKSCTTRN